jgi:hypothetical protein
MKICPPSILLPIEDAKVDRILYSFDYPFENDKEGENLINEISES